MSLLMISLMSMFFMTAVTTSNVTWSNNSGTAIPDPFSPTNVVAFIDQAAWVYTDALNTFLINPISSDFGFIPENLVWIKDNAELTLAVAVGLADPMPQISAAPIQGQVAGAITYSPQYYDNIFTLLYGDQ